MNENEKKQFDKIARLQPLVLIFGLVGGFAMAYLFSANEYRYLIAVTFGISAAAGFQYVILREARLLVRSVAVRHIDSNFGELEAEVYSNVQDKSLSVELKKPTPFNRYYAFCFTEEPDEDKILKLRDIMENYIKKEKYIQALDGFVVSVMAPNLTKQQREKLLSREYCRMKMAAINPFRKLRRNRG